MVYTGREQATTPGQRSKQARRRYGTPPAVLVVMAQHPEGLVEVDTAYQAFGVARQTVIQAVCRLRRDGWRIETVPPPHAFYRSRVKYYKLDERDAHAAELLVGEILKSCGKRVQKLWKKAWGGVSGCHPPPCQVVTRSRRRRN